MNLMRQALDGGERGILNAIVETRREAYRAQHAQLIFTKALFGRADGADDSRLEVLAPANEVQHLVGNGVKQHSVDAEIASLHVFLRALAVANMVGMAPIAVAHVAAKR